jgi:signal transduction histidine kinase
MMSRWQRYLRTHLRAADVALALVSVCIALPGVLVSVDGAPLPALRWPSFLITGIACAALMWVRRRPRVTAVVTIACAISLAALHYTLSPLLLAPAMVALAFVALHTSQRTAYAWTATGIAVLLCTALITRPRGAALTLEIVGTAPWLLLPAALGGAARLRLAYLAAATARAEYAERTREEEAQRQVASERMRIARELHDVIAHHLALANAQSGTVMYLMDTELGKARTMAGDLNGTIVAALEELKTTVGLLRQADDPESPLEPAPGLAQLPRLADSFGSAGLTVTITTEGEPAPLPAGTDLAAYRIIQEALTNVTKHAAASDARVRLAYTAGRLAITITNDGSGPPPPAAASGRGYGLTGMRERALSVGGRLHAGQRPGGGFEVAAELPLHPRRPDQDQTR